MGANKTSPPSRAPRGASAGRSAALRGGGDGSGGPEERERARGRAPPPAALI